MMDIIDTLAIDLWVGGEPVTVPGMLYTTFPLRTRSQLRIDLHDREKDAWIWRLQLQDLNRLDELSDRPGWCGITAALFGADGSLYAPFRPFLFYAAPWVHPSLLVWPDAWCGPVVVAIRVPGPLPIRPAV